MALLIIHDFGLQVIRLQHEDGEANEAILEAHNKCDECCPVIGCETCGSCKEHDKLLAEHGITSIYE